jgi:hypothetical protein
MGTAMRKRYWSVAPSEPDEATSRLREEYEQWEATRDAAYDQIKLFYALTGGYPVIGDELHISVRKPKNYCPGLRITKRSLYTILGSEAIQLCYEVEADETGMEELEEY